MPNALISNGTNLAKGQQPFTTMDNVKSKKNDLEKWQKEQEKAKDFLIKTTIASVKNNIGGLFGEGDYTTQQMTQSMTAIGQMESNNSMTAVLATIAESMQSQTTLTDAVSLQGHNILYDESNKNYSGTPVTYSYSLTNNSASKPETLNTIVNILDENNKIVLTDKGARKLGNHQFTWDGKDNIGKEVKPGKYRISVRATSTAGSVSATTASNGTVQAVVMENGEVKLQLEDGKLIEPSQITKVEANEENKATSAQFTAADCVKCLGMEAVVNNKKGKQQTVVIEAVNSVKNTIVGDDKEFAIQDIQQINAPHANTNNSSLASAGNYIGRNVSYEADVISWKGESVQQTVRLPNPQAHQEYEKIELIVSKENGERVAKVDVAKAAINYQGKEKVTFNQLDPQSKREVNEHRRKEFNKNHFRDLTLAQQKVIKEYIQQGIQNGQLFKTRQRDNEGERNANQGINIVTWDGALSNGGKAIEGDKYKIEVIVTTKNTTNDVLNTEVLPISNIGKVKEVITQNEETILVLTNGDQITTNKIIDIA